MILTSHQPDFLPYMGFFYKAFRSDALILSDDVQFSKKGMHNWNRIKTENGPQKLTIPVHAHHDSRLCEIKIAEPEYSIRRAVKVIEHNYRKAPHYEEGEELLKIMQSHSSPERAWLSEMNQELIEHILERFGIELGNPVVTASSIGVTGHKDDRIFQMCKKVGADAYFSGLGAAAYHDPDEYSRRGVELIYTDYEPVRYPQMHGEFVPNLSVIDYIFNCGYEIPGGWKNE